MRKNTPRTKRPKHRRDDAELEEDRLRRERLALDLEMRAFEWNQSAGDAFDKLITAIVVDHLLNPNRSGTDTEPLPTRARLEDEIAPLVKEIRPQVVASGMLEFVKMVCNVIVGIVCHAYLQPRSEDKRDAKKKTIVKARAAFNKISKAWLRCKVPETRGGSSGPRRTDNLERIKAEASSPLTGLWRRLLKEKENYDRWANMTKGLNGLPDLSRRNAIALLRKLDAGTIEARPRYIATRHAVMNAGRGDLMSLADRTLYDLVHAVSVIET